MKAQAKIFEKAFTIVELMVVIAIIGLLSSIVINNVNAAKLKSKDATFLEQASQLRTILELDRGETGTYVNFQPGGFVGPTQPIYTCNFLSTRGNYGQKFADICNSIINNQTSRSDIDVAMNYAVPTLVLSLGVSSSTNSSITNNSYYSIMIWTPSKQKWYCIGSTGKTSNTGTQPLNAFGFPGCSENP